MRLLGAGAIAFSAMLCGALQAQTFAAVIGRVVDSAQHSIPNVQVRLRPPANSDLGDQIVLSSGDGQFSFPRVQNGPYLLEVSQWPYLLYRQKIDVPLPPLNLVVQRK